MASPESKLSGWTGLATFPKGFGFILRYVFLFVGITNILQCSSGNGHLQLTKTWSRAPTSRLLQIRWVNANVLLRVLSHSIHICALSSCSKLSTMAVPSHGSQSRFAVKKAWVFNLQRRLHRTVQIIICFYNQLQILWISSANALNIHSAGKNIC